MAGTTKRHPTPPSPPLRSRGVRARKAALKMEFRIPANMVSLNRTLAVYIYIIMI